MQNSSNDDTLTAEYDDGIRASDYSELTWRAIGTLNVFRLVVAATLLALFVASGAPRFFGDVHPTLFVTTALSYLGFSIVASLAIHRRLLTAAAQILIQVTVDIAAVVTLMHASGGISSGLGGLLVVFVGAGSLLMPRQVPGFFAAMATIAVLGEQVFSQFSGDVGAGSYSASGVLGAIIFAIALAARPLGNRLQTSEALALQRGIDLANLSELNEYIVQHLRESIVVIDDDNRIRLINSSAEALLGIAARGTGRYLSEVSTDLASYVNQWRQLEQESGHTELTIASEVHSARISVHLAPLGRGSGRGGPVLIFLEDTSMINARVQQSKLASLGRLSASIAHEIRNPVGAMSHAGQLLAESPALSTDDLRLTEIIRTHSERVSHIIDNVLQLSRRESVAAQELQLQPWLEDFAREFTSTLELHEGELSLDAIDASLVVHMDPSHLRQVLWNLCDNAVNYGSDSGGILIEIRAGRTARGQRPFIEVLDRGRGVDKAVADKIFEPFFTNKTGGTGLGLYISRELCELNQATLVYQPRDSGGSIFRIVFSDSGRWQRPAIQANRTDKR